jgi:hypothetical protein
VYGLGLKAIHNKEVDLNGNANVYMMFTSSSHTPNVDTHDYENDLTNIVSGTNLNAAGVALTNVVSTYDTATNTLKIDCDDVSVATVTATGIRNLHIVDKTSGSSATNPLIAYCTLDGDLSPNAGTLSVTIDAAGIYTITV